MQTRNDFLLELMKTQHKKDSAALRVKQMTELENFLNQTTFLFVPAQEQETEVPATTAKPKADKKTKATPQAEKLEAVSTDDDQATQEAFDNLKSDDTKPTVGADEIRKLLNEIVRAKGADGKADIRKIMAKFTKNQTAMVNDILAGKHEAVYAALKKI